MEAGLLQKVAGFTFDHLSVSPCDVCAELSALDTSKACGSDGICPRILKKDAAELAILLAALFNKLLADGVLPLDWVRANITPVFKKKVINILLAIIDQSV